MSFCKELFKAAAGPKQYPRPSLMTPEEAQKARREWWETEVDDTLEQFASSIRVQRALIALLLIALLLKL
jgi:hypothetical protein